MKPILLFDNLAISMADLGPKSSIPSISTLANLQNRKTSHLGEDEGLFIGYGALPNAFPYRQRSTYNRNATETSVPIAVLENDYLKATFLPSLGGRLWSLIDKTTGRNLLYTNDIIRPSNLAVKNAWFSGGVEWNIGVIGHTPTTTEPLFVAKLETPDGDPVLRMYEYERIREVSWQMDFWLTEESRYLICRMRIHNDNDTLRPMYWWSNIAVPEYNGGRLVTPATEAFSHAVEDGSVVKVPVPEVAGIDISRYNDIPTSVDYFFDVDDVQEKYIASFDSTGYGLVQTSTNRLRGRKLFSWGHTNGARKWQNYLTNNAGDYIEIQAGVERTQYGCVPMPPKTVWEWVELYGPISVEPEQLFGSFDKAVSATTSILKQTVDYSKLEQLLQDTKDTVAKKPGEVVSSGSGYGALENAMRIFENRPAISPQLDFGATSDDQRQWLALIETGAFLEQDPKSPPESYMKHDKWRIMLEKAVSNANKDNWYAWYQLGLIYMHKEELKKADKCFSRSLEISENCWAHHGMAVLAAQNSNISGVLLHGTAALKMRNNDLAMAKDCLRLLLDSGEYSTIISLYNDLSSDVKEDGRIRMYLAYAYFHENNVAAADEIVNGGTGLEVADIREGEELLSELWLLIEQAKHPNKPISEIQVPIQFDFRMYAGITLKGQTLIK